MRRPVKRTKEEIAESIIRDGEFLPIESGSRHRYYKAFGQRWCLHYTRYGTLVSIEQVDGDGHRVGFPK